MSVIINELDVAVEPEAPTATERPAPPVPAPPAMEVWDVVRHELARSARTRAV